MTEENKDLPIVHEINPTKEEKRYIEKAIRAGTQSTEILYVLATTRVSMYNLYNLVQAMENQEHIVYPIYPEDTQKMFTILKGVIKQVAHTMRTAIYKFGDN